MQRNLVDASTILLVRAGSHAYGTNTPTSDLDVRGIMIPPSDYYLGMKRVEQYQEAGDGTETHAATTDERVLAAGRVLGFDDNFLDLLDRERRYEQKRREWDSFKTWKATRNEARSELECKYGYDTKHGMHLVRLMRTCAEILTSGTVLVKRPDAAELLSIRQGAWSYERLIGWARDQDAKMAALAAASTLPHTPDREAIGTLCEALLREGLGLGDATRSTR